MRESIVEQESRCAELAKQLEHSEDCVMKHQQMLREAQQQLREGEMVKKKKKKKLFV
jgi:hypothetical protein